VYQARPVHAADNHAASYAVKVLRRRWQASAEAIECLRREAQVGQSVTSAHLISVLAAHVGRPPYYLVMPWLDGTPLEAWLRPRGNAPSRLPPESTPLPLAMALWIVRQIAEGLDALYAAGWMHADIKPANVFVSPEMHATLLDLGFAGRCDARNSLLARPMTGTLHYMAPELLALGAADIRSDIYSLGVLLYQLLSGRLPFPGDDPVAVARAVLQETALCIRRLVPLTPKPVAGLVHQMLAKEPLRRPQTPRELIERLVPLEIDALGDRA
jgi:serine/threonine protein kinase